MLSPPRKYCIATLDRDPVFPQTVQALLITSTQTQQYDFFHGRIHAQEQQMKLLLQLISENDL